MSIFGSIKKAILGDYGIFGRPGHPQTGGPGAVAPAAAPQPAPTHPQTTAAAPTAPRPVAQPAAPAAAAPAPQPVDVAAVLTQKAAAYGKPSNWRTSIVDLLTLLGLDSSLTARKELAEELNVHAGAHGSAEQNIALHKAVMKALAENGGQVPADLRD